MTGGEFSAIVAMTRGRGLAVTASGIETDTAVRFLSEEVPGDRFGGPGAVRASGELPERLGDARASRKNV